MNRSTLARRYAPLIAVAAVQLLIIATVPSKAPNSSSLSAAGGAGLSAGAAAGGTGTSASGTADTAAGAAGSGGVATAGGAAAGAGAAGSGGSVTAGGAQGAAAAAAAAGAGDTSHCVGGREFDPNISGWAPPCVAGKPGAADPNNGGATYQGATADTITIVDYVSNYGAEVNAILQAEGLLVTADEAGKYDPVMANFINTHYVLYGRKLKIITYQGTCQSVPPDLTCLIPEMDRVVQTYHPYAVFWDTTLCSQCFAELARNHVIGFGGAGFSDEFSNGNGIAPYFYSADMSSSRIEREFAEFYCAQLNGKPVQYAETNNPAQNFNGKPRVLGVISTNDQDNENTVKNVLFPALAKCGVQVTHTYFYDQNINTAAQQVQAGIAAMDTTTNPATSVLCLCDPVAPAFLYEGEQQNNYFPENLIATDQGMDFDQTGQSYVDNGGQSSLGCPTPKIGCEYDVAFGLSPVEAQGAPQTLDAVKLFDAGGGQGLPPIPPLSAQAFGQNYIMMANLMEAAGPHLDPVTMASKAATLGTIGGGTSNKQKLALGPGNFHWVQDARLVYYDKHKTSPFNGKAGTYVQLDGTRFDLGGYGGAGIGGIPATSTRTP